jgi:hypothetical protein
VQKEEFDIRSMLQIAVETAKKTEWYKGMSNAPPLHTTHLVGRRLTSLSFRGM